MKLIPAFGELAMQNATTNPIVHKIVDIMLNRIDDRIFFKNVAFFLREHELNTSPNFAVKLDALRHYGQIRPDANGHFVTPSYVLDLVEGLEALYSQPQRTIQFQRGAIVELLALRLIRPRCKSDECFENHRFIYERNPGFTDQIDVVVFSKNRKQIEAYTCKIKSERITSVDCTNLTYLEKEAQEQDYDIHVGAICFDSSYKLEQRLEYFSAKLIKAYGVNNMRELQISPF